MANEIERRAFLAATGGLAVSGLGLRAAADSAPVRTPGDAGRGGAVAIASGNGLEAVRIAREAMAGGGDPAVAAVRGVAVVEADPDDMSVGLGGLPNEVCVVSLDAAVMHGPTHRAGSVAALEDTVHAAGVALKVLQTTDHVMFVGEGAKRFARQHGFPHADLLTEKAREAWLRWKRGASDRDDWLDVDETEWNPEGTEAVPHTTGTIHLSCRGGDGSIGCCTTTSGLSYKIPGRVGDSPIIGAGLYCDNEVGSAGATGRGEAVIQSCGAFSVVRHMADGKSPTEACLAVLKEIADRSRKQKRLVDGNGRPNFNVKLYAVRKDGAYGGAAMLGENRFAVCDAVGARREDGPGLF